MYMTTHKNYNHHNRTLKIYSKKKIINGKIISEEAGWKTISIYGKPYDRGFAHGYLLKNDLKKVLKVLPFHVNVMLHRNMKDYIKVSNEIIRPKLKKCFPEYYDEIKGISDGAKYAGVNISLDYLIAWNSYMSLSYYFKKNYYNKCSAFIATGNATENGKIVMAHNTHTDFVGGKIHNINILIKPEKGYNFFMQTCPGFIASVSDWFVCSTGIIGTETTISGIDYTPKFGIPFFCRIREAMQYGETLEDYVRIMKKGNAGDYACSWMFGDIKSNEIMLFELGLKEDSIQRTKNGVFYGANSAMDDDFRKKETHDIDHDNITTSVGARNNRLNELLNKKYYGKINISIGKKIMADHYDVYLDKNERGQRSICKHMEKTIEHCARPPFYPFGCVDGKVVDSNMAEKMSFWGRFGSACGREFSAKKHIKEHPEFKKWEGVLEDFKREKWVKIET